MKFELYRIDELKNGKRRFRYNVSGSDMDYCKKVFNLKEFKIKFALATIFEKEKQSYIVTFIKTFSDYEEIVRRKNICWCWFEGLYQKELMYINIDRDISMINIISERDNVREIIEYLTEN